MGFTQIRRLFLERGGKGEMGDGLGNKPA